MILLIDNYDSFTWNLYQYFCELGADVLVKRNDALTLADIDALKPQKIVISPGPCTPDEAGISLDVIRHYAGRLPILGVCLGHQAMAQAFGGKVVRAAKVMHGKTSPITPVSYTHLASRCREGFHQMALRRGLTCLHLPMR